VGYCIPDKFSSSEALAAFAQLTAEFVNKSDLRIVNLLADTDCDVPCAAPFLQLPEIDGVFLYEGNDYCGRSGRVTFANNKPIVGGRIALWGSSGPAQVPAGASSNIIIIIIK
jgi:hypothetical protein